MQNSQCFQIKVALLITIMNSRTFFILDLISRNNDLYEHTILLMTIDQQFDNFPKYCVLYLYIYSYKKIVRSEDPFNIQISKTDIMLYHLYWMKYYTFLISNVSLLYVITQCSFYELKKNMLRQYGKIQHNVYHIWLASNILQMMDRRFE